MTYWMNLYKVGWYHRAGKPGTMPWHPGDVYPTQEAAMADIDKAAPYIGTVPFTVPYLWLSQNPRNLRPFEADIKPVPLSVTRKVVAKERSSYDLRAEVVEQIERTDAGWTPI